VKFFPYKDINDMVVIITFFKLGNNTSIFRMEITVQEWEIAMLCIISKDDDENYPFLHNVCHRKYIKKFWTYFNISDKCFDVIQYEGIFITGMRVEGYDATQFDSWKNSLVFRGVNKRKREEYE
jgi:hypothetical protein